MLPRVEENGGRHVEGGLGLHGDPPVTALWLLGPRQYNGRTPALLLSPLRWQRFAACMAADQQSRRDVTPCRMPSGQTPARKCCSTPPSPTSTPAPSARCRARSSTAPPSCAGNS